MNRVKAKQAAGLTLIEIMVVVLLIAVAVLGAMGFRLYCVVDAKKADVQAGAARLGSMLLENWKGVGGLATYNPYTQFSAFNSQFTINPTNLQVGASSNYFIQDNSASGIFYFVTLSRTAETSTSPAVLNAAISWRKNYRNDTSAGNPIAHTILITTYAD